MALKSTVYKINMQVADMDRHYYADHDMTIASHPSENEERLMMRLLAFALNAHERLEFANGLTDQDEPDIWLKELDGEVALWIQVGQPEEKAILKACGRSGQVRIYNAKSTAAAWWSGLGPKLQRARNLEAWQVDPASVEAMAAMAQRSMSLLYSIQDGEIWVRDEKDAVLVAISRLR